MVWRAMVERPKITPLFLDPSQHAVGGHVFAFPASL